MAAIVPYRPITKTGGGGALVTAKKGGAQVSKTLINIEKVLQNKIKDKRKFYEKQTRITRLESETKTRTASEATLEKASKFRMNLLDKVPNFAVDAFAKIMNFLGIYLIGWITDKLPKIINAIKDVNQRIQKMGDIARSLVTRGINIITAMGGLIAAKTKQILTLDFGDKSGDVKKAQDTLDKAFDDLESDWDDGVKLLTAPLGSFPVSDGNDSDPTGPTGPTTPVTGTDAEKYKKFYEMAKKAGAKYPELVAAQFALESGYGSAVSGANNYFGLKATTSESGASMGTTEYYDGVKTQTSAKFMNFASAQDAVNTLVNRWYKDYKGYKGVNNQSSAGAAAEQLQRESYATDPRYAQKLKDIMAANKDIVGAGDGSARRQKNQTPAYQQAVKVGRSLESQGYRAWQHPDFSVYKGYTGSGMERVMRRSYNSYHNYGEALDFPLSHNTEAQLNKLAKYFSDNRSKLGVAELKWKDDANHFDHLHVSFKGGGSGMLMATGPDPATGLAPAAPRSNFDMAKFRRYLKEEMAKAGQPVAQPKQQSQQSSGSSAPHMNPTSNLNSMLFTALSFV